MPWQRVAWLAIAVAAMALAWLAEQSDPGQRLEYAFADTGAELLSHEVDSNVVIVAIDAQSLLQLEKWPWPRRFHADLIERLAPASPSQVFFDIDFSARSNPGDDGRLRDALAGWRGEPIMLPAFYQHVSSSDDDVVLTEPLPALRRHAQIASVNLRPAADGLVRTVQSAWTRKDRTLPAVAAQLNGVTGSSELDYWIDFTIDPSSFRVVSYNDVLANRVPAQNYAGTSVFV
jgi:CHASE2 domain-containing sensor protein